MIIKGDQMETEIFKRRKKYFWVYFKAFYEFTNIKIE